jgi:NAD(P)-dependent dehydrogenase (short-subunit alcohol dehydrogenase family)
MARGKGRFAEKLVLVTGAASGIGRETALAFAREGARLAICDVNDGALAEAADRARAAGAPAVLARRVDVSDRAAMEAFAREVHAQASAVDVLVNNAGVALKGGFLATGVEDWEWILGVNLWGVIHGCKVFVPPMVARGQGGHVVNVSSSAGYFATEMLAAYATTKYAVFGLSEALRQELAPHRIGVSTICPGIVDTGIVAAMRMRGDGANETDRAKFLDLYRRRAFGPERVARAIVDAVAKDRGVVPVTAEAWALYYAKRVWPGMALALARRITDALR